METALFRIWTHLAKSISYDGNHYSMNTLVPVLFRKLFCWQGLEYTDCIALQDVIQDQFLDRGSLNSVFLLDWLPN